MVEERWVIETLRVTAPPSFQDGWSPRPDLSMRVLILFGKGDKTRTRNLEVGAPNDSHFTTPLYLLAEGGIIEILTFYSHPGFQDQFATSAAPSIYFILK